jgi:hypothetical protein
VQGYLPYTRIQEPAPVRTHQAVSLSSLVIERPRELVAGRAVRQGRLDRLLKHYRRAA